MTSAFRPTSAAVDLVLSKATNAKSTANGWQAQCPAHEDRVQSLSISQGDDGRALLDCKAGCQTQDVVSRWGISIPDLFVPKPKATNGRSPVVATYNYVDAAGSLVFQAVRRADKTFAQCRPDGRGGTIWNLQGVQRVVYHLPEVLDAVAKGQTIYIAEGEKDVDNLRRIGLAATCNAMGAGKWQASYSEALRGADVVILPDNDQPGRNHAELVGTSLQGIAARIRVLTLPNLPDHGDVSDWLNQGHTADELQRLAEDAPAYEPSPTLTEPLPERRWLTEEEHDQLPPGEYLIDQEIPTDGITVLYGPSGSGKTFVALDYGMRIAQSKPVMFVPAEDSAGLALRRRAWRSFHQSTTGTIYTWPEEVNLMNPGGEVDTFIDQTRGLDLGIMVFDTLHQSMVGADENSSRDMGIVIQSCKRIQRETGAAVMLVHHTGKSGASERGSSALRGAAHTMIELSNDDGLIRLSCDKAKNSAPFPDRYLRLLEHADSCVIVPADSVISVRGAPITKAQIAVLDALNYETFTEAGAKSSQIATVAKIPEGSLWRTLSTLKRLGYITQGAKGDPFHITPEGKAALDRAAFRPTITNISLSNGQPSQPSLTITSPSDGSPSTITTNHHSPSHPLGVMVDGGSDGGQEPETNHSKIQGLIVVARCQIRAKNFDKAREHAEAIGKLSRVDRNEIEAEIEAARGTA